MMALMEKLRRFMYGRYGGDKLCVALIIFSLLLSLVAGALGNWIVQLVSYLPVIWALFRMFSKNTQARYKENAAFLKLWNPVEKWGTAAVQQAARHQDAPLFSLPELQEHTACAKG